MAAKAKLAVLLLILCVLPGCSSLRNGGAPEPSFDLSADLEKLSKEFESSTNITNYYTTPAADRKDTRDRFVLGRIVLVDLRYLAFIKTLTADKQQLDTATDLANLTLNLAGTLVGGARAKTNLAAAAAGISGAKATIDKDYFYEKSIEALIATMNAKRKEVLIGILTGLTLSLDDYPFERAVTDLQQYYLAGTLNGAIQFINVQAAQSETSSNKELKVLYRLAIPTPEQISDIARLTDSIGASDLTLENANKALKALGVEDSQLPTSLDDMDGKPGARQRLKDKVREAKNLPADEARNTAIKRLTNTFKAVGILK